MPIIVVLVTTFALLAPAYGRDIQQKDSFVAIIIDDLGPNFRYGKRAASLKGPVACAILPHTRFAQAIAVNAYMNEKEVLLHQPMEAIRKDKDPGPGVLDNKMAEFLFKQTLTHNLESIPHVSGINNHMGSLLTTQANKMDLFMQIVLKKGGLFFVDSLTSPHSVATQAAAKHNVPYLVRDVFLDNQRSTRFIEKNFDKLLRIARHRGKALAIGHPYPETMEVLERRLPGLEKQHIRLISLASMLVLRD